MAWRIWYDTGDSCEGGSETEWNVAPRQGVLIVKESKGLNHMGCDYYWFENGNVKSCAPKDLDRYLIRDQGLRNVKLGRWADDSVWNKALEEASRWP